jgi:hypothetical protein
MLLAMDFRRQARVCARLAEECDDRRLAERLKRMASDLLAKADDFEEFPGDRASHEDRKRLVFSCYRRATGHRRASTKRTPKTDIEQWSILAEDLDEGSFLRHTPSFHDDQQ